MKKLIIIVTAIFALALFWNATIIPSSSKDIAIAESIKSSMRAGNPKNLSTFFDKNIELVIDSEEIAYKNVKHSQAELILKSFFKKYPPKDFKYVFQGTASNVRYCTATYESNATVFQVYILMKITQKEYLINTLHIKKE